MQRCADLSRHCSPEYDGMVHKFRARCELTLVEAHCTRLTCLSTEPTNHKSVRLQGFGNCRMSYIGSLREGQGKRKGCCSTLYITTSTLHHSSAWSFQFALAVNCAPLILSSLMRTAIYVRFKRAVLVPLYTSLVAMFILWQHHRKMVSSSTKNVLMATAGCETISRTTVCRCRHGSIHRYRSAAGRSVNVGREANLNATDQQTIQIVEWQPVSSLCR